MTHSLPQSWQISINSHAITEKISIPNIPGYIGNRESPVSLKLIEECAGYSDNHIFYGYGISNPRRLGIASFIT
jgi:deoxyinosine 3'endonuclease (endonuclease V)